MANVRKNDRWLGAILFVIVLLAYIPAIRGGFSLDDDVLITDNANVNSPSGLVQIWKGVGEPDYYPLTYSFFWMEWRLWGLHATGYHFVNVLLHALGVLVLWRVLLRLRVPGAWAAALLFAVHPVSAGTVAWISEGKNTLSFIFYALSFLAFLKSEEKLPPGNDLEASFAAEMAPRWYILALTSFLCALLSKAAVVMLPFALLGAVWWLERRITARHWRKVAPFFALSFAFGLTTLWFQKYRAGTGHLANTMDGMSRLAIAGRAIWFYFIKAILPVSLSLFYPERQINPHSVAAYLPHVALLGALVLFWKYRNSLGRGALFGVGYFVVTLLPVLGFFDMYFFLYSHVADHFQYFALAGLMALITGTLWHRLSTPNATGFQAAHWITTGLAVILFVATWNRAQILGDVEKMWRDTIEKNPASWAAHGNLAGVLRDKHHPEEAVREYLKAVELNPNFGNAHLELAELLAMHGDIPEATYHFGEAARLLPKSADAHLNYAIGLERQGRLDEAVKQYQVALQINPQHLLAHNSIGALYLRVKQLPQAEEHLKAALQIKPDFAPAHFNYGNVLAEQGRLNDAAVHFSEAIRLDPPQLDPYVGLATVLAKLGQKDQALALLKQAIQMKPDYEEAKAKLKELTSQN